MEAVTQTIDSTLLNGIIPLPKKFQNKQVEVIVSLGGEKATNKSHTRFIGLLSQESFDEISLALMDTQGVDANEW